ncbi:CidA/LrgA family protein [Limosilactobacillus sp. STM2_1]|uniref:CidA/LrgA family protein n=1 Tax=Limosilactobacillus rudii TaxID=2759755 RepID=A0A7W3UL38_9LACO|nr:CidA/LrgA family protein [Limosilactobacillus rudii]MBB1079540.1 CidA/LrgA family protein [Limosilactobacillus rudii]MBB1097586.1 CidA/LrgA family protein [Limosilactobacillus rudii]MCD7134695.1 CidA/LrgA family protein [Limosilactobacillus rudii]
MTPKGKKEKKAPILVQMGIFAGVLWVASIISSVLPSNFIVPTPVIGLVLLYLLLTLKIVKVEWVEDFGIFMISLIGFLFVPSGIQIANDLRILREEGLQIVLVIIIATVTLLVVTAYVTRFVIAIHHRINQKHGQITRGGVDDGNIE